MTDTSVTDVVDRTTAIETFWGTTRLVVIDVETVTDGQDLRAVAIGVVNCRAGFINARRVDLVHPEVPVDPESARIHGLTDDHLAGQPVFAEIADAITADLTAGDDSVIFVAHNAAFDISVLRAEYSRIDEDIAELPVLDTTGRLAASVDVFPDGRSLHALSHALGVINPRPHDALDDAYTCAAAAVELLNRAAVQHGGHIDTYIDALSPGTTTRNTPIIDARVFQRKRSRQLPTEHTAGHSNILPARAGRRMLANWVDDLNDCAELRCRHLHDRVANAGPAPHRRLEPLHTALDTACADNDTAGAATLLDALLPLLEHLPPLKGKNGQRRAHLAWAANWRPKLTPLGRCDTSDQCPACRAGNPCPLDIWPATIAEHALGDPHRYAASLLITKGKDAGQGVWTTWRTNGHHDIADEAVAISVQHWAHTGHPNTANQAAQLAWRAGCQHPDVIDRYVGQIALAGKPADLRTAIATAKWALKRRNNSTHPAWTRLQARTHQLDGELRRLQGIDTGLRDTNGQPIYKPRHHPQNPQRTRPQRFRRHDNH